MRKWKDNIAIGVRSDGRANRLDVVTCGRARSPQASPLSKAGRFSVFDLLSTSGDMEEQVLYVALRADLIYPFA
jgi:hypothetical protein